jgi:hypothetical protein
MPSITLSGRAKYTYSNAHGERIGCSAPGAEKPPLAVDENRFSRSKIPLKGKLQPVKRRGLAGDEIFLRAVAARP